MSKKQMSLFDRCFRAADCWLRAREQRPVDATDVSTIQHIAYRCGYFAGYERAKRDLRASSRR